MAAVWWLTWGLLLPLAQAFCPSGCSCDDTLPSAKCVGVGFTVVPILLNPTLRRLDLAHNNIKYLEDGLVFLSQLQELDLSHNTLAYLGTSNFQEQKVLETLNMAHNNLSALLPGAFRGLARLTVLDLSHNSVDDVPDHVMDDLVNLTILRLSHNRLFFLTKQTFIGPKALQFLDLCDNYFRHVPTDALIPAVKLQDLQLCRNRLTHIGPSAFPNPALTVLSLETNNIDHLDQAAFHSTPRLKNLSLTGNSLDKVPTNTFSFLPSLEFLSLSRNKIQEVKAEAFQAQGHLTTLELSRNPQLEVMSPKALSGCTNIKVLILSQNPLLKHLPHGLLTPLKNLQTLDLRANSIESLTEEEVPWVSLKILDLRDNPLVCNCSVEWLARLIRSVNASITSPDLQCAAPDKLKGFYLSRLSPREQLCGENVYLEVVLAVVAAVAFCVLLLTFTLLLYSPQIQRTDTEFGQT